MISYVKGELSEVLESGVVIDVNGMGVEVFVPVSVMSSLPPIGSEIKLYTYFRVSEDAMSLYGFNSRRDLNMFRQLIGVSGIGPKGALAVLSTLTPDDLRMAVMAGDAKSISAAPGIGAKTAQRIIIDLKDKIDLSDVLDTTPRGNISGDGMDEGAAREAIEALAALGYSATAAAKAVRSVDDGNKDAGVLLKEALRKL